MRQATIKVLCISAFVVLLFDFADEQHSTPPAQPASAQSLPDGARLPSAGFGRSSLNRFLDDIAAGYTASRAASVASIHSRAEAEARQVKIRWQILSLIGALPKRTPLRATVLGESQAEGFRVRKVLFESQPNFPVTALLYVPDGQVAGRKSPAILMTPGHYPTGKASDARMAALFARNGFVVLSYDPIGQGERLQYPDPANPAHTMVTGATGEHAEASLQPMLIGDTFARYVIWDAMRGVDYLSNLPEVDANRIGAFGCSGGGTITALASALDARIAAIGVACYITSFDALLPTLGPQDAEQSSPRLIASGLDFPDLIEVAAPRPYAVIATYSDMFPFAGARASVAEARRFYSLLDPASAGIPSGDAAQLGAAIPTKPALNADTTNQVSPTAALQFITGPGKHGALGPITGSFLSFFIRALESGADAAHPVLPPSLVDGTAGNEKTLANLPADAFRVTPTGQVATSYPKSETVFSLNLKRASGIIPAKRPMLTGGALARAVREATGAEAEPGASKPRAELLAAGTGPFALPSSGDIDLQGDLAVPGNAGRHPAVILLVPDSIRGDNAIAQANRSRFEALASAGNIVLAITPRPSPPGTDDMKSPLLGPFYLLSLRADLVGRTLIGLRIDDVIRATDYLACRPDVDPSKITAIASGHMGLVVLHAAVLDPRLRKIAIDHVLTSYRSLLEAPLPLGAPEDVVPGVLLRYDIPNLAHALGSRLTETDPLKGTDDLSQTSIPIAALTGSSR